MIAERPVSSGCDVLTRHSPGRGIVAKRMWMNWFRNAGLFGGLFTGQEDGLAGNRLAGFLAGEQPFLGLSPAQGGPQQFQQSWRQQGLPVLAAFAATYPNPVAAPANVNHFP